MGCQSSPFADDRDHDPESVLNSHPRRESLMIREKLVEGVRLGITSQHGLIAHGRGEAYDYLLGERTREFADTAVKAAVATMLLAEHPVISVNGNAAALVPRDLVQLAEVTGAKLEINLFHVSDARVTAIEQHLATFGGANILKPTKDTVITTLNSGRRYVNPDGIARADVVFVPLEDGDRCAALRAAGKTVITVDLNPLSRTSRDASITIVDNVVRAVPRMIATVGGSSTRQDRTRLQSAIRDYDHQAVLAAAETALRSGN